ncbi:MAG: hypothetical protein R3E39_32210 [Anaerolineae bacterium]
MERYRAVPQPEVVVCPPPRVADWYREQVAPVKAPVSPPVFSSVLLYERDPAAHEPVSQIDPEPDISSSETNHSTPAQILTKVRAPYDAEQKPLAHMLKRLRRTDAAEDQPLDELEVKIDSLPTTRYVTAFGTFSFPELYERGRKYAAYALHHTYHLPPDELEDGLQAGGITLWECLQQEVDGLQDKNITWVGLKMIYSALHATRRDWKHRQKTQAEGGAGSKSGWGTHSHESRQADKRTDIHQAIVTVAEQILTAEKGKRQQHDLWALYGLTMLQMGAGEVSRLFGVREQSMGQAYRRVRQRLQASLPNYAPAGDTRLCRRHGPEALPEQDMQVIRQGNGTVSEAVLAAVHKRIEDLNADTRILDEVALAGIREGIAIATQARQHGIPQWTMQRAYRRVHLLIAAERDPTVRMLRLERRVKPVFTLTAESAVAVEQLAQDLLEQPRSYEKLVALHAHIGNLGISTTAKHFNIPTSTLRYYSQQIGKRLQTPTRPAREGRVVPKRTDERQPGEGTIYSW